MVSVKSVKTCDGVPVLGIGIQGGSDEVYNMYVFPIININGEHKVLNRYIMARGLSHGFVGEVLDSFRTEDEVAENHLRNRLKLFSFEKKDITKENTPAATKYTIFYHNGNIGRIIPEMDNGSIASVNINYDRERCDFIAVPAGNDKAMVYDRMSNGGLKPYGFVDLLPIK